MVLRFVAIKSHSYRTIPFEGIRDIIVETSLISATLRFTLSSQTSHPIILPHFKKREALQAKQIIIGIMNCMKSQIKPDDLDPEKDLQKIMTLGKAASF